MSFLLSYSLWAVLYWKWLNYWHCIICKSYMPLNWQHKHCPKEHLYHLPKLTNTLKWKRNTESEKWFLYVRLFIEVTEKEHCQWKQTLAPFFNCLWKGGKVTMKVKDTLNSKMKHKFIYCVWVWEMSFNRSDWSDHIWPIFKVFACEYNNNHTMGITKFGLFFLTNKTKTRQNKKIKKQTKTKKLEVTECDYCPQ